MLLNNAIPLFLLLYLLDNSQDNSQDNSINILHTVLEYVENVEINRVYSIEKINIAKKITPLVPTKYARNINTSIQISESLIKLIEVGDIFKSNSNVEVKTLDLDPKERAQKILSTIQKEAKNSNIENVGMIFDVIINMDRYKKMFTTFTTLMNSNKPNNNSSASEKESASTNKVDKLLNLFVDKNSEEDKDKVKNMAKILNLINKVEL